MESLTYYICSVIIILVYATVIFFIAQSKKDNSIIDTAYGPGFVLTASVLAALKLSMSPLSVYSTLLLILISIWGIRLSYRIYNKNKDKPEDFRYASWREEWSKKGKLYYTLRSYFQIFILQGLIISIVLLPFTLSLAKNPNQASYIWIGLILWIVGFYFEAMGDKQLDTFIKDKKKIGTIMKSGLWKYTRHPNYFGEATMWWAIAFLALLGSASFIVLLSPLLITYLLLYVSGIPMLEKKWAGLPEWEVYKKKTSSFIPLPPHK